jgi:hypothetical protein
LIKFFIDFGKNENILEILAIPVDSSIIQLTLEMGKAGYDPC